MSQDLCIGHESGQSLSPLRREAARQQKWARLQAAGSNHSKMLQVVAMLARCLLSTASGSACRWEELFDKRHTAAVA